MTYIFLENKYYLPLQTHHAYSTLKQRGNDGFHVASTWNIRGMLVGPFLITFESKLKFWKVQDLDKIIFEKKKFFFVQRKLM